MKTDLQSTGLRQSESSGPHFGVTPTAGGPAPGADTATIDPLTAARGLMIRAFEDNLFKLFAAGHISGTVHTCIGQELSAIAVADELRPEDWLFSNHRCHGHYLARTGDVRGLLAEIIGLDSGICGGRGGSQHICRGRFLSNGIQGGSVPIAAGCAARLKSDVQHDFIAVAMIGDGTLGEGIVYEALNVASKWDLPLLVVVENNGYAQSTDSRETLAGSIRDRFQAFGIPFFSGNIWNEATLRCECAKAFAHARSTRGPAALGIDCFRLRAHSKGDDFRKPEQIAEFERRDPLNQFLRAHAGASAVHQECEAAIETIQTELLCERQKDPTPPISSERLESNPLAWRNLPKVTAGGRVIDRIREGLRTLLASDERVIVIGEDIEDPYGGAFKATKGLADAFPGRIRNTPISEAAITGLGVGMAVAGYRPIVEIMFGDFLTLAADQLINHAGKFRFMYNGQISVPLIVRTPMGGKRGYGATHSQSLEKHFLGVPGLRVVALNALVDPVDIYTALHAAATDPTLVVENKLLYGAALHSSAPDGRSWQRTDTAIPTLRLPATRPDLTMVCYGGMVSECEAAAEELFRLHEIAVEIVVPTQLYPLDILPISDSVRSSRRLLVIEEGQGFAGFGSETIAQCSEFLENLAMRCGRTFASPHPIPCARRLEQNSLPGIEAILKAARRLCDR
jgi:2-oxoisovalerate dehydrogenase E1 component